MDTGDFFDGDLSDSTDPTYYEGVQGVIDDRRLSTSSQTSTSSFYSENISPPEGVNEEGYVRFLGLSTCTLEKPDGLEDGSSKLKETITTVGVYSCTFPPEAISPTLKIINPDYVMDWSAIGFGAFNVSKRSEDYYTAKVQFVGLDGKKKSVVFPVMNVQIDKGDVENPTSPLKLVQAAKDINVDVLKERIDSQRYKMYQEHLVYACKAALKKSCSSQSKMKKIGEMFVENYRSPTYARESLSRKNVGRGGMRRGKSKGAGARRRRRTGGKRRAGINATNAQGRVSQQRLSQRQAPHSGQQPVQSQRQQSQRQQSQRQVPHSGQQPAQRQQSQRQQSQRQAPHSGQQPAQRQQSQRQAPHSGQQPAQRQQSQRQAPHSGQQPAQRQQSQRQPSHMTQPIPSGTNQQGDPLHFDGCDDDDFRILWSKIPGHCYDRSEESEENELQASLASIPIISRVQFRGMLQGRNGTKLLNLYQRTPLSDRGNFIKVAIRDPFMILHPQNAALLLKHDEQGDEYSNPGKGEHYMNCIGLVCKNIWAGISKFGRSVLNVRQHADVVDESNLLKSFSSTSCIPQVISRPSAYATNDSWMKMTESERAKVIKSMNDLKFTSSQVLAIMVSIVDPEQSMGLLTSATSISANVKANNSKKVIALMERYGVYESFSNVPVIFCIARQQATLMTLSKVMQLISNVREIDIIGTFDYCKINLEEYFKVHRDADKDHPFFRVNTKESLVDCLMDKMEVMGNLVSAGDVQNQSKASLKKSLVEQAVHFAFMGNPSNPLGVFEMVHNFLLEFNEIVSDYKKQKGRCPGSLPDSLFSIKNGARKKDFKSDGARSNAIKKVFGVVLSELREFLRGDKKKFEFTKIVNKELLQESLIHKCNTLLCENDVDMRKLRMMLADSTQEKHKSIKELFTRLASEIHAAKYYFKWLSDGPSLESRSSSAAVDIVVSGIKRLVSPELFAMEEKVEPVFQKHLGDVKVSVFDCNLEDVSTCIDLNKISTLCVGFHKCEDPESRIRRVRGLFLQSTQIIAYLQDPPERVEVESTISTSIIIDLKSSTRIPQTYNNPLSLHKFGQILKHKDSKRGFYRMEDQENDSCVFTPKSNKMEEYISERLLKNYNKRRGSVVVVGLKDMDWIRDLSDWSGHSIEVIALGTSLLEPVKQLFKLSKEEKQIKEIIDSLTLLNLDESCEKVEELLKNDSISIEAQVEFLELLENAKDRLLKISLQRIGDEQVNVVNSRGDFSPDNTLEMIDTESTLDLPSPKKVFSSDERGISMQSPIFLQREGRDRGSNEIPPLRRPIPKTGQEGLRRDVSMSDGSPRLMENSFRLPNQTENLVWKGKEKKGRRSEGRRRKKIPPKRTRPQQVIQISDSTTPEVVVRRKRKNRSRMKKKSIQQLKKKDMSFLEELRSASMNVPIKGDGFVSGENNMTDSDFKTPPPRGVAGSESEDCVSDEDEEAQPNKIRLMNDRNVEKMCSFAGEKLDPGYPRKSHLGNQDEEDMIKKKKSFSTSENEDIAIDPRQRSFDFNDGLSRMSNEEQSNDVEQKDGIFDEPARGDLKQDRFEGEEQQNVSHGNMGSMMLGGGDGDVGGGGFDSGVLGSYEFGGFGMEGGDGDVGGGGFDSGVLGSHGGFDSGVLGSYEFGGYGSGGGLGGFNDALLDGQSADSDLEEFLDGDEVIHNSSYYPLYDDEGI